MLNPGFRIGGNLLRSNFPRAFAIQIVALFLGAIAVHIASSPTRAADRYEEPSRPRFHFSPERTWTNDPNGMVFFEGEYHLFYQDNPFGAKWGHMSWGHAASRDLVHWEHLPVALAEENGVMIFSGSAVVDWHNTSGFGKDGKPPMVAIYTGHYTGKPLQNQQIAYSTDRGRTWTKFAGNPVLDIGERDFRDPRVFWHEPTKCWVMAVAWPTHRKVRFYASPNLKDWKHLSDFGPAGATEGVWECPDLFPLGFQGKEKWVLIVNVSSGAPVGGSGCQYFIGDFDGKRFSLDGSPSKTRVAIEKSQGSSASAAKDAALWADYGPDFYAAVSWNDIPKSDGRRLWLGWMSNWIYANDVPTAPWRGAMSIPRELSLRATAEGVRLVQTPIRELQSLRGEERRFNGGTMEEANAWLKQNVTSGYPLELSVEFEPASKGRQGLALFKGAGEETIVGIDRVERRVYLDRTRSGNVKFHNKFPGVYAAPLAAAREGRVRLHVFVDACSIEVFVNDGERVVTALVFPSDNDRGVEVFSTNEGDRISGLDVWPLKSIWK